MTVGCCGLLPPSLSPRQNSRPPPILVTATQSPPHALPAPPHPCNKFLEPKPPLLPEQINQCPSFTFTLLIDLHPLSNSSTPVHRYLILKKPKVIFYKYLIITPSPGLKKRKYLVTSLDRVLPPSSAPTVQQVFRPGQLFRPYLLHVSTHKHAKRQNMFKTCERILIASHCYFLCVHNAIIKAPSGQGRRGRCGKFILVILVFAAK